MEKRRFRYWKSGKRCVAFGCGNTALNNVSMHSFPVKKSLILKQWTNFVKTKRDKWLGPTHHSVLCSAHFTKECYPYKYKILESIGQKKLKRSLLPDAVPTIHTKTEPLTLKNTSPKKQHIRQNQKILSQDSEKSLNIGAKMDIHSIPVQIALDNTGVYKCGESVSSFGSEVNIEQEVKSTDVEISTSVSVDQVSLNQMMIHRLRKLRS